MPPDSFGVRRFPACRCAVIGSSPFAFSDRIGPSGGLQPGGYDLPCRCGRSIRPALLPIVLAYRETSPLRTFSSPTAAINTAKTVHLIPSSPRPSAVAERPGKHAAPRGRSTTTPRVFMATTESSFVLRDVDKGGHAGCLVQNENLGNA